MRRRRRSRGYHIERTFALVGQISREMPGYLGFLERRPPSVLVLLDGQRLCRIEWEKGRLVARGRGLEWRQPRDIGTFEWLLTALASFSLRSAANFGGGPLFTWRGLSIATAAPAQEVHE